MAFPRGRAILQALRNFRARKWPSLEIENLAEKLVRDYGTRNEITAGGIVTAGSSLAANNLNLSVTAIDSIINGRLKAQSAADSNVNYLSAAGTVGTPIFANGATAAALSLSTDQTAYCTLIQTNSANDGTATDLDNSAAKAVIVVAGTATTYADQTAHLTSQQIQDALDASTAHAGVTGWAHIARILFDENSASPALTIVMNRNNILGV